MPLVKANTPTAIAFMVKRGRTPSGVENAKNLMNAFFDSM